MVSWGSDLTSLTDHQLFKNIDRQLLSFSLKNGLWNEEKSAFAFCVAREQSSCFVYHNSLVVDASGVERGNLGKLGIAPRRSYAKINTFPTQWINREDGILMIEFTTQAWKDGQRYTVREPLIILDGKPIYR